MILANTYHLALRPGSEIISSLGGLHRFMGWNGPILTDSGGFQIFSLESERTITDRSVVFRSHIDGSVFDLSPERAITIQEELGADVMVCPGQEENGSGFVYDCTRRVAQAVEVRLCGSVSGYGF